ncbi:MAG: hypothetical protein JWP97_4504 [Labilithrix sp.]|nr:hypothetical protein [Labilithrix sp.]
MAPHKRHPCQPMRRLRVLVLLSRAALAASLATTAFLGNVTPAAAQAPPGKEVARKLFDEGAELEKKADYVGALAKYKEAEAITVTPGLRFHKAYCFEMQGKLTAAVDEYEAADKLAQAQNKADVHAAVGARLDPLRVKIPQLSIKVVTTGARDLAVQLDTNDLGSGLYSGKPFRIDPGEHDVRARAAGYENFVKHVTVPEGQTTVVEVVLKPKPGVMTAPPPPVEATPQEAPPQTSDEAGPDLTQHRSLGAPIATTVGAVLLLGAGATFYVLAGSAQKDAQESCAAKIDCDSERSKVRTFDAVALGSAIGGAALAVTSIVLWASSGKPRAPSAWVSARPAFAGAGASGGHVLVEGRF